MAGEYVQYKVCLTWDEETSQTDASVPTLGIGDYGPDTNAALNSLRQMVSFHVECLLDEGEQLPEPDEGEGVYIRVRLPVRGA